LSDEPAPPRPAWQRLIPLAVIFLGLIAFFAMGGQHYLSLEALRANRALLLAYVAAHPFLAAGIYAALYVAIIAFSIPGGTIMTIAGGFLFGTVEAAIIATCCATLGGTILFLATKTALADFFRTRMGPRLLRFEDGFNKNAFSYLFVSRLIPMFPFPIVNIASGLLGVNARTFVTATFFGIIPATVVFAGLGSGLGKLFDKGHEPNLRLIFEPQILYPLLGLATLALIPPVWRAIASRRASGKSQ
jgi:uncharacterized membrane protein YdjX (TVP38/TMEM64 family)